MRAFNKWKDAFYIKPDAQVFENLLESIILVGDFDTFDKFVKIPNSATFFEKNILEEPADVIVILFLKAVRHLLDKNQGAAEVHIADIVERYKSSQKINPAWAFDDLQSSLAYLDLPGECKDILENLVAYLGNTIDRHVKIQFESALYAYKLIDGTNT